jgi:hypothetical protein
VFQDQEDRLGGLLGTGRFGDLLRRSLRVGEGREYLHCSASTPAAAFFLASTPG